MKVDSSNEIMMGESICQIWVYLFQAEHSLTDRANYDRRLQDYKAEIRSVDKNNEGRLIVKIVCKLCKQNKIFAYAKT